MNFAEIIKIAVLKVINSIRFTEVCIGNIIQSNPLKIKIDEKILITQDEIVKISGFHNNPNIGTKVLLIRESGGQRYFLINTIISDEKI